jgi:ADP-heptose:LPS heptosyltransferase
MKIRQELFIDRYIIKSIAFALNLLVRLLGFILHIDHSLDKQFTRIAVCKFKGMGSIVQATPLLKVLRSKYPEAEIIFISSYQNKNILEKINLIDNLILLDDSSLFKLLLGFPGFCLRLIQKRIDVYLDLEIYSSFSSLVTTLSMAKNRVGYYLRSSNYRMGIYTHMIFFNMRMPIYQAYLQMARLLGDTIYDQSLYHFESDCISIHLEELTDDNYEAEQYFVINPNASDLRVERRWPKENFINLITQLRAYYPQYHIFLIGSKGETEYVNFIYSAVADHKKILNLAGRTSLDQLICLLKHAKLFITNDSGPMHLAFSLSIPTISLFGPCLPSQYGIHQSVRAFHKNIYCSPCVHEFMTPPCKGNNTCMKLITPEEVFKGIEDTINSNKLTTDPYLKSAVYYDLSTNPAQPLGIVRR